MQGPTAAIDDRLPRGAGGDHGGDGVGDHAIESAAPAGMGGADHAGAIVGEQHRRAIGGEDAEHEAGTARDHRVGDRRTVPGPRIIYMHDVGGVALLHRHERRRAKLAKAARACRCHLRAVSSGVR